MRLYFARHGESEANVLREISNRGLKHGLTDKGREQAYALADQMKKASIARIYTSPLLRAIQTAEILVQALQVDYEETDALREFDCGIAEGRSDPEAWALLKWVIDAWFKENRWEECIEQGESYLDMKARFLPFVNHLLETEGDCNQNFVLIGHGGLYYCMLPLILSIVDWKTLGDRPFPNAGYVLAEARGKELICLEWCGTRLKAP